MSPLERFETVISMPSWRKQGGCCCGICHRHVIETIKSAIVVVQHPLVLLEEAT